MGRWVNMEPILLYCSKAYVYQIKQQIQRSEHNIRTQERHIKIIKALKLKKIWGKDGSITRIFLESTNVEYFFAV